MQRYIKTLLLMAAALLLAGAAQANSDGVKKYIVGDAVVWAIADSISERDLSVFPAVTPEITAEYAPLGVVPSAIMTFIIELDNNVILVDAGLGASGSYFLTGLEMAGFEPEDISLVLITHYHGDHIGGLLNDDGRVFPNAKILSSRMEQAYWLDYDTMQANPRRRASFELARRLAEVYIEDFVAFDFNKNVVPGIKALEAGGHTPGHTAFLLESKGQKLLFWGDLAHAAAIQFPLPHISATYDMDPEKAAATRKRFMEMAAVENMPIAGAHLPFAGVGYVEKTDDRSYIYKPLMP